MKKIEKIAATVAERQLRWRAARDGSEQRVEIWLPIKTAQSLKNLAAERGLPTKDVAALFIERGLVRLMASRRSQKGDSRMAIYVDAPVWEFRGRRWCHLLADSLDELHAFAAELGLRQEWFQRKARFPHYDITESVRKKAVQLGAIEANNRTIVTKALALREEYKSVMMASLDKSLGYHEPVELSAARA